MDKKELTVVSGGGAAGAGLGAGVGMGFGWIMATLDGETDVEKAETMAEYSLIGSVSGLIVGGPF